MEKYVLFYCLIGWNVGISKRLLFLTLYDVARFVIIRLLYSGDTFEYIRNTSVTTAFNLSMYNNDLPALDLKKMEKVQLRALRVLFNYLHVSYSDLTSRAGRPLLNIKSLKAIVRDVFRVYSYKCIPRE